MKQPKKLTRAQKIELSKKKEAEAKAANAQKKP